MKLDEKIKTTDEPITFKGKNNDTLKALTFVSRTRSTDIETRQFICFIHVEKNDEGKTIAVATDGNRMHIAELSVSIPDGEYNVLKSTASKLEIKRVNISGEFPNWKRIYDQHVNESPSYIGGIFKFEKSYTAKKTLIGEIVGKICFVFARINGNTDTYLNSNYIADLYGFDWKMSYAKNTAIFYSKNMHAIIAAINYEVE